MATPLWFTLRTGFLSNLIGVPASISAPARYLSRLRTKTPKKIYWFRRLAPPLFNASSILQKLEERPEARFEKIAPALVSESSSVFYDPLLNKFTNMIMLEGQKRLAEDIITKALEVVKREQHAKYRKALDDEKLKIELNPLKIFHGAISNCKPVLTLSPLKRGGITYQVPTSVPDSKAEWTSMKWIILASRDKAKDQPAYLALAKEILNAFNNEGRVVKRKFDLHKQCEANKAYAHYRWSR